jgi:hypothetical protein
MNEDLLTKSINLNVAAKKLDGTDSEQTLGQILAGALVGQSKGDALKYYRWARVLYAGQVLEIDLSDFDVLKHYVKTSDNLFVLAKAQILEILYAL